MKKIFLAAIMLLGVQSLSAQTISELFQFSQRSFSTSTARSASMAGAFTSLGADMSSMSINPAGLGMYSSSEAGFTLGVNAMQTTTDYGGDNVSKNWNTQFALPNVAGVYNLGDVTIGFGFNRLANFNRTMSGYGNYEQFNSKARIWADQLTGISSTQFDDDKTLFRGQAPMLWDAIMAYDSYLVDPYSKGSSEYGVWGIIDPADYVASQISTMTEGSLNELVLSAGYNFDDIIYVGMSLGFQYLYYSEHSVYEEYNLLDGEEVGIFDNFYMNDRLYVEGFGFDMKFGVTARPLPWLRVGLAYHTPSWMAIDESSYGDMEPYFTDGNGRYSYTPDLYQDYNMQSPSRLLAGVSATLFNAMILSVDYERTWYNTMKYNTDINTSGWREGNLATDIENLPNYSNYTSMRGDINLNAMIKDYYRAVNNIRVGVEVQPARGFFLRGGVAYSDSPYKGVESYYDKGALMSDFGSTTRYTAGLGYRTGSFNVDFAYTYSTYTLQPSKFFDYITNNSYDTGYILDNNASEIIPAGTTISSLNNLNQRDKDHNFLLTFSWRM